MRAAWKWVCDAGAILKYNTRTYTHAFDVDLHQNYTRFDEVISTLYDWITLPVIISDILVIRLAELINKIDDGTVL